jgi:hypothetical protein
LRTSELARCSGCLKAPVHCHVEPDLYQRQSDYETGRNFAFCRIACNQKWFRFLPREPEEFGGFAEPEDNFPNVIEKCSNPIRGREAGRYRPVWRRPACRRVRASGSVALSTLESSGSVDLLSRREDAAWSWEISSNVGRCDRKVGEGDSVAPFSRLFRRHFARRPIHRGDWHYAHGRR